MTEIVEITLETQSGFYAMIDGDLGYAPNFVQWPDGTTIQRSEKDTYSYPVNGYSWFNTRSEAKRFFNHVDEPHGDATLVDSEDMQFGTSSNSKIVGPIPPDNDPNDDNQGILEKPDPYILDGPLPELSGVPYDIDMPPAHADDAHLADPYDFDPTLEMDVPHQ